MTFQHQAQTKINLLFALVSGGLFALHVLAPGFEQQYSYQLMFAVVLSLGLIHGCLDFEIAKVKAPKVSLFKFLLRYVSQILGIALIWLFSPTVALGVFLLCTAWHFGETDFSLFKLNQPAWVIFIYGLGLTGWLFGSHIDRNLDSLKLLGITSAGEVQFLVYLAKYPVIFAGFSLLMILVAVLVSGLYRSFSKMGMLVLLLAVVWTLPVLQAFTVYFGFWHSLHTLYLIKSDIQISTKGLILKAIPYLVISISMTWLMIVAFSFIDLGSEVVLVVFISSLTLPHAITMHDLLNRYKIL